MRNLTFAPAPAARYVESMILSVGFDLALLRIRDAVLRSAGHEYIEATTLEEALLAFDKENVLLVILCHSIPADARRGLCRTIKRKDPQVPVLALHHAFDFIEEADISLDNLSGPNDLLSCIATLLKKRPH